MAEKQHDDWWNAFVHTGRIEDYLRYQYNELEQAQLQAGEQAQVEQETQAMTHAEDIKSALYTACNALNGDESCGASNDLINE